ncbi:hypothetical protein GX586_11825 [bacterium]|nr:hypothetical protein [bacterium]
MAPDTMMDLVGVWVAALMTLSVFSFLFRDNVLYRVTEAVFVGGSVGFGIVIEYQNGLLPKVIMPIEKFIAEFAQKGGADFVWAAYMLASLMLGLLFLARFSPKHAWISRLPMAYLIGIGTGISVPLTIQSFVFTQVQATLIPVLVRADGRIDWVGTAGNISLIVGVLAVLYHFFFSLKKTDPLSRGVSKIGIAYLMLGFGSSFAFTVMARVTLLVGRASFLKDDWVIGTLKYFNLIPP